MKLTDDELETANMALLATFLDEPDTTPPDILQKMRALSLRISIHLNQLGAEA